MSRRQREQLLARVFQILGNCASVLNGFMSLTQLYDRFLSEFAGHVRNMKLGAGAEWDIDMGPLISAAQFNRVTSQVADAVERGATVVVGGAARPDIAPTFFEPTILTDVTDDMDLSSGETFGPVVSVYRVDDDAEAIRRANESEYGLNAKCLDYSRRRSGLTDSFGNNYCERRIFGELGFPWRANGWNEDIGNGPSTRARGNPQVHGISNGGNSAASRDCPCRCAIKPRFSHGCW